MTIQTNGLQDRGKPDALNVASHYLFRYCGGTGGAPCADILNTTSTVFSFRVPKLLTFNRRIIFENPEFRGIRIWNDGGAADLCSHSTASPEHTFYVAFSDDGVMSDAEIVQKGIPLSGALPYTFEVTAERLPQPVLPNNGGPNPSWNNRIYVHVYWGNAAYVNEGSPISSNSLVIVKHDYDIKV